MNDGVKEIKKYVPNLAEVKKKYIKLIIGEPILIEHEDAAFWALAEKGIIYTPEGAFVASGLSEDEYKFYAMIGNIKGEKEKA